MKNRRGECLTIVFVVAVAKKKCLNKSASKSLNAKKKEIAFINGLNKAIYYR